MSTSTEPSRLLEEFPPHSYDEWKAAAEALLKGAPFEKKLITPTYEGFSLQPIYRRQDIENLPHLKQMPGSGNYVRGRKAAGNLSATWEISQELPISLPEEFNKAALYELERGQSELNIPLDKPSRRGRDSDTCCKGCVGENGLCVSSLADLEKALENIHLDYISLYLHTGINSLAIAAFLLAYANKRNLPFDHLRACVGSDPLGTLTVKGELPISLELAYRDMAALTRFAVEEAPQLQTILVQGHPYHEAGASSSQELAFALATGVDYLRAMQERDLEPDLAAPKMRFALSVGGNFFIEIAKLRAARILWARILEAYNVPEESRGMFLHARTGQWNKTLFDPYVNMLRTTTEAFSAVIGMCDSLHVAPFDEVLRPSNEFGRRSSRNIQHILAEECELVRPIDMAGGSWAIESLTDQICQAAWATFQEIEKEGGMAKALAAGIPQAKCAETAQSKKANLAKRRDTLVGTNIYPNATEGAPECCGADTSGLYSKREADVAAARSAADGAAVKTALARLEGEHTFTDLIAAAQAGATAEALTEVIWAEPGEILSVEPLVLRRGAEDFEDLRNSAFAQLEAKGKLPQIFQANIGPSRMYRARADWTSSFFQVGGFEMLSDQDFETPDAAVQACKQSGAPIAIITGTDDTYAETIATLAPKLREACPGLYVIVAGAPGDNEAAWREAGVDDFVNIRVNNYQMLHKLLTHIGALNA